MRLPVHTDTLSQLAHTRHWCLFNHSRVIMQDHRCATAIAQHTHTQLTCTHNVTNRGFIKLRTTPRFSILFLESTQTTSGCRRETDLSLSFRRSSQHRPSSSFESQWSPEPGERTGPGTSPLPGLPCERGRKGSS